MLAGVGFDLGPIQTDGSELDQSHCLRNQQNLGEQRVQLVEKALPEVGDGGVVGMGVGADGTKGHRVVDRQGQLAAGEDPGRIALEDQRLQHVRVVGPTASRALFINSVYHSSLSIPENRTYKGP